MCESAETVDHIIFTDESRFFLRFKDGRKSYSINLLECHQCNAIVECGEFRLIYYTNNSYRLFSFVLILIGVLLKEVLYLVMEEFDLLYHRSLIL